VVKNSTNRRKAQDRGPSNTPELEKKTRNTTGRKEYKGWGENKIKTNQTKQPQGKRDTH